MLLQLLKTNRLALGKWYACGLLVLLSAVWIDGHPARTESGYIPYPGQIEVRVLKVEAPNRVWVQFETWPGFYRKFRVTLPDIEVPEDSTRVPACERRLARKAKSFTENFLTQARHVYVLDMTMEDSASEEATAPILTERGNLAEALKARGLARSVQEARRHPWCTE